MKVESNTSEELTGDIMGNLSHQRGRSPGTAGIPAGLTHSAFE